MKKSVFFIFTMLFLAVSAMLHGQTATIQTVNNAAAGSVSVSITLSGFNATNPGVSAFQWTVNFDNSRLTYVNTTSVIPLDGWTVFNPQAGRVTFAVVPSTSFYANSPTVVCNMNFTYNGSGSAFLNWYDSPTPRHIYDDNIDEYFGITYVNGSVNPATGTAPSITTQPSNATTCTGAAAAFSIVAAGTSPLSYQWQISTNGGSTWANQGNSGVYSGMTTATMNISAATAGMSGYQYRCYVSNGYGNATSNAGSHTVNASVAISTHPGNQSVNVGGSASFAITATGTTPAYQWQVSTNGGSTYTNVSNGGSNPAYSGATAATLNISGCTAGMNTYRYRCNVSNTCNNLNSNAGILTVLSTSSPTCTIDSVVGLSGNNVAVAVKMKNFNATNPDVSAFQWTIQFDPANLTYVNTTTLIPADGWTVLNPQSGRITFAVVPSASFDASTEVTICYLNFTVTGTTGCFNLNWYDIPTPRHIYDDNIDEYMAINWVNGKVCVSACTGVGVGSQPSNTTVCAGSNAQFCVTATGTSPINYQWQLSTNGGSTYSNITGATSNCYNLTGVTTGMSGYRYRCYMTNCSGANNVTSNAGALTVNPTVAITSHPSNSTICAGANTSFSTTATGIGLGYQWQVSTNGGTVWANLANAAPYSNVTTNTLSITAATAGMNSYQYRCGVTSSCGNTNTNAATLTVNPLTAITSQPTPQTQCVGQSASFSVTATGIGLTYQWRKGGSNISGATSASYTISSVVTGDAGNYDCVVSGSCGNVTSNAVALTVNAATAITVQPTPQTVCVGQSASFSVTATGSGLTYQWRKGGSNISGATSASYTISSVVTGDAGNYDCVVSGSCGNVTSNAVALTVNISPTITAQPTDQNANVNGTATFAVTAAGTGLTYQWQVNTGSSWVNCSGAPYTNVTTSALTINPVISSMDGYQYRCVVSGSCLPSVTSDAAILSVTAAPAFTSHPNSASVCEPNTATFTVVVSGAVSYQWQQNSGSGWVNVVGGSGATTTSYTTPATTVLMNAYQYRCQATNTSGTTTSNTAILTINENTAITSQPSNQTANVGGTVNYSVIANGSTLSYQWEYRTSSLGTWANVPAASPYSGVTTATLTVNPCASLQDGYEFRCVVTGLCGSASSNAASLTISSITISSHPVSQTECEGNSITLSVTAFGGTLTYDWQKETGGNWVSTGINTSSITLSPLTMANSGDYRCVISNGSTTSATSNTATITVNPIPSITQQPADVNICVNQEVGFSIVASGSPTYQWEIKILGFWVPVSGTDYSGETTADLTVVNTQNEHNGLEFRCIITNACGSDTSNAAILTITNQVTPSVSIAVLPNDNVCEGTVVNFTAIPVNGGSSPQYQWYSQGNPVGSSSDVYSFSANDSDSVWVVITSSDACAVPPGTATSNAISLTVKPAIMAVATAQFDTICLNNSDSLYAQPNSAIYTYHWSVLGGSNPVIGSSASIVVSPIMTTEYLLIINDNYCSASDTVRVVVDECSNELIANAFSPNTDGKNDLYLKGYDITIVNRWGIKLYQGMDGWDGTYNGTPVTAGTYYCIAKNSDGSTYYQGSVTVVY